MRTPISRRRFGVGLCGVLVFLGGAASAVAQSPVPPGDSCISIEHKGSSSEAGFWMALSPAWADGFADVSIDGPSGPQSGQGPIDVNGLTVVYVPLFQFGPHTVTGATATVGDEVFDIDILAIGDGGTFVVGADEPVCDFSDLVAVPVTTTTVETTTTIETTTTSPTSTTTLAPVVTTTVGSSVDVVSGSDLTFLWLLLIFFGSILILLGLYFVRPWRRWQRAEIYGSGMNDDLATRTRGGPVTEPGDDEGETDPEEQPGTEEETTTAEETTTEQSTTDETTDDEDGDEDDTTVFGPREEPRVRDCSKLIEECERLTTIADEAAARADNAGETAEAARRRCEQAEQRIQHLSGRLSSFEANPDAPQWYTRMAELQRDIRDAEAEQASRCAEADEAATVANSAQAEAEQSRAAADQACAAAADCQSGG